MKRRFLAWLLCAVMLFNNALPVFATEATEHVHSEECGHVPCETCGLYDCEGHTTCTICGALDCEKEHVKCSICNEYDCVKEHKECEICSTVDCTADHAYCEACEKYDCGETHQPVEPTCTNDPETCQVENCTCKQSTPPPTGEGSTDSDEPKCECGLEKDHIGEHQCDCADGVHAEGCLNYTAPTCSCGTETDEHSTECPLYKAPVCPNCEEELTDGHSCECKNCGQEYGTEHECQKICEECGEIITDELHQCPICDECKNIKKADHECPTCVGCGVILAPDAEHLEACTEVFGPEKCCNITKNENGEYIHEDGCVTKAICEFCGAEGRHFSENCPECKACLGVEGCTEHKENCLVMIYAALRSELDALLANDTTNKTEDELYALSQEAETIYDKIEAAYDVLSEDEYDELIEEISAFMMLLMEAKPVVLIDKDYIYFDLYYGDVVIEESEYSGKVRDQHGNVITVSGTHSNGNQYYIFQSNPSNTKTEGFVIFDDNNLATSVVLPQYERLSVNGENWSSYISRPDNHKKVMDVFEDWKDAAESVGREATQPKEDNKNPYNVNMAYRIQIGGDSWRRTSDSRTFRYSDDTRFHVTIDNVWSGFHNDDMVLPNGKFPMNATKEDTTKEYSEYTSKGGDKIGGLDTADGPHYRVTGGLSFRPGAKESISKAQAHIYLKGDNRFGNIHYETGGGAGGSEASSTEEATITGERTEQLFFHNGEDKTSYQGTLTVGNFEDNGYNHFCAVIGGSNNPDYVPGLVFDGGTIYAGATVLDNCTAIGGGGCGFGGVTIRNNGENEDVPTVIAVTATNGAAIGGGIGDGSNGGAADIFIEGGIVYAYNKGLAIEGTRESGATTLPDSHVIDIVMPAVAIGSGSSRRSWTVPAKIEISGGTIYAECVGGTAIGGGSSVNLDGANAVINISGGNVTAKSIAGNVEVIHEYDGGQFPDRLGKTAKVSASTSIGGGTAGVPFRRALKIDSSVTDEKLLQPQGNGGTAVLSISGNNTVVNAGSIGGGGTNELKDDLYKNDEKWPMTRGADQGGSIGAAKVTISGGNIQGQVIMAKGAKMDCSFDMTGGTIDNGDNALISTDVNESDTDKFVFLKPDGGAVYVENGNATMSGGTIKNCTAKNGGVFYVIGGDVEISGSALIKSNEAEYGGVAYVNVGTFTMSNGTIENNKASFNGGVAYVTGTETLKGDFTMTGGVIRNNTAINGGAAYVTGGDFKMISGTMENNNAIEITAGAAEGGTEGYGGAACVSNGDIVIGVENCNGLAQSPVVETHAGTSEHTDKLHPILKNNSAEFGGALAVRGGTATVYCGTMIDNYTGSDSAAPNNGTGTNVFMDGDEDSTFNHHLDNSIIGSNENHGMVSIGGILNVIKDGNITPIKIIYHSNNTAKVKWEGEAPEDYYLNLPYKPSKWTGDKDDNSRQLTFVGWSTETGEGTEPTEIRKKPDYSQIGEPVKLVAQIIDGVEKKEMHFYAVWAPEINYIKYAYSLDDTNIVHGFEYTPSGYVAPTNLPEGVGSTYAFKLTDEKVNIGTPTYPGYSFVKWVMYANHDTISNWNADPNINPYESAPTKLSELIDTSEHIDGTSLKTLQNFGDITLVAIFEPAINLKGLTITKSGVETVDANNKFIFNISGTSDKGDVIDMNVYVTGNGSVVVSQFPVGTYTITEMTDWSWRYEVDAQKCEGLNSDSKITISDPNTAYSVTIANKVKTDGDKWLDYEFSVDNVFGEEKHTVTPVQQPQMAYFRKREFAA